MKLEAVAIRAIQARHPEAKTKGFRRELRQIAEADGWEELGDEARIIPDAFAIFPDRQRIELFEVEDSHPITPRKMQKLVDLWFHVDCEMWELILFVTDRYGLNEREIALVDYYYQRFVDMGAKP